MRRKVDFCADWRFIREDVGIEQADEAATEPVTLPHTWNAQDGTDAGTTIIAVDAGTPNAFLCQRIPRKKKSGWSLKVRPCRHRCF